MRPPDAPPADTLGATVSSMHQVDLDARVRKTYVLQYLLKFVTVKKLLLANDNDEHQTIHNFLLTAPKILILGSKIGHEKERSNIPSPYLIETHLIFSLLGGVSQVA